MRQTAIPPLYLPYISRISPHISPVSPPYLADLEHAADRAERGEAERGVAISQQQQLYQYCGAAARDEMDIGRVVAEPPQRAGRPARLQGGVALQPLFHTRAAQHLREGLHRP